MPESNRSRDGASAIVLGFDFGTQRIGVAVGDTVTGAARPVCTLERRGDTHLQRIGRLIAEYAPQRLLVGVPYNMSGTATSLTRPAVDFARELEQRFGLPVALVDERQSSREAEAALREARRTGQRRRRTTHADVDREAARVIVERWLAGEPALDRSRAC